MKLCSQIFLLGLFEFWSMTALAQQTAPFEYLIVFVGDPAVHMIGDTAIWIDKPKVSIICGAQPTTVTLRTRAVPAYYKQFHLQPHQALDYEIWRDIRLTQDTSHEEASDWALMITSDAPITAFVPFRGNGPQTHDAFMIQPRSECGTDYRILGYYSDTVDGWSFWPPAYVVFYSVAAFEDGTEVVILPAMPTRQGTDSAKGISLTLQQGQYVVVYARPELYNDPTGTPIKANKPVAVQLWHGGTVIPSMRFRDFGVVNYDQILLETLPPVSRWGRTHYITTENIDTTGYVARVLSSENNTTVFLNGVEWGTPLEENEYRDTLLRNDAMITSTAPVLIAQFVVTDHDVPTADNMPHMTIIPPLEWTSNDLSFYSFTDTSNNYAVHYVSIVTHRVSKDKISLDGELIDATQFFDIPYLAGEVELSAAVLKVSEGPHRVTTSAHSGQGFVLVATGNGSTNSFFTMHSYGYGVAGYQSTAKLGVSSSQPTTRATVVVHPNPTQDKVTIEWNARVAGDVKLEVFSMAGVLVHEENVAPTSVNKPFTLDTRPWPSGAYSIVLRSGDEEARGTVIKN